MNGLDGAFQLQMVADLLKGQIGLLLQKKTHFPAMGIKDHRLPPAEVMTRSDVALVGPQLDELFDHAQGYFEPLGNLFTSDISLVVCVENPLPQIHRERGHEGSMAPYLKMAT